MSEDEETCTYCGLTLNLDDPATLRVHVMRDSDGDGYWNDLLGFVFCSEEHVKKQFAERDLPPWEAFDDDDGFDFGGLLWGVGLFLVLPALALYGLINLVMRLF